VTWENPTRENPTEGDLGKNPTERENPTEGDLG